MAKKIIYIPLIALLTGFCSFFMQSCNYLDIDQYINDMQSLDTVFQKKELTQQFLFHVYSYLPSPGTSWDPVSSAAIPWVVCTDEAFDVGKNDANNFCNNIYSSAGKAYMGWKRYYEGIRNASIFLQRVYECKELSAIQMREYIGEAQFLKAYFYFELMKQYGPVCIVPESGFTLEQPIDEILIPRSTWDECVTYVDKLLQQATQNLPLNRPTSEYGKPTSGAANAVRSRLLLYNASPLFNGNTSYANFVDKKRGVHYINQKEDNSKWAAAAAAAKLVIDNGGYELYVTKKNSKTAQLPENVTSDPDYYKAYPEGAAEIDAYLSYADMFNGEKIGSQNPEVIFSMPGMTIDKLCAPLKMQGWSQYNIPQKLVDAYYMCNGKTIEEGASDAQYPYKAGFSGSTIDFSGYTLNSGVYGWYLNREMRFYVTVGFNDSYYLGSSTTDSKYKNFMAGFQFEGNCSLKKAGSFFSYDYYCMTGYLCRKFQHPEDCYTGAGAIVKKKRWIDYRLAEIYMNYVEALNELDGTYTVGSYTLSKDPAEIRKYFNLIRHRAGLPGITLNQAGDRETMKKLIQRERQIEFAWEGLRYFDLRRWKKAVDEENGEVEGMAVNKDVPAFYRLVKVREVIYAYKSFSLRKNFWPIPQTEIIKNPNLVQNPGWE